jgi:hypothetical protein
MARKRKEPKDMTTDELVDHLFHPDIADALRDVIAEHDDEESTDEEPTP